MKTTIIFKPSYEDTLYDLRSLDAPGPLNPAKTEHSNVRPIDGPLFVFLAQFFHEVATIQNEVCTQKDLSLLMVVNFADPADLQHGETQVSLQDN